MAAGFRAYAAVLADPRARAFSLAGFVARLPLSMTGIGTVLLVSLTTGSFGRAGLITGVGTAVGAVAAPLWGRLIDRVGQARVLVTGATLYGAGVALVVTGVVRGWPISSTLAGAVLAGLGFTTAGACVRARWTHRLAGSPLLDTAFAVEAVLDEVTFIVGPVLVTFLATTIAPGLGLAVCGVLSVAGALALAAQRGTQPPRRAKTDSRHLAGPLPVGLLLPLSLAYFACGGVFGGMELVVVAFARQADVLRYSGVLLMCWAIGSLVAGVVAGSITWRRGPVARFRIGAVLLAVSLVPLPFVTAPWLMSALLALSGFAIAPTLIAGVTVTQTSVPAARFNEALGWTSTGITAGVAAGAAAMGPLVDGAGTSAGFWGVLGFGVLLTVAVLFLPRSPVQPVEGETGPREPLLG